MPLSKRLVLIMRNKEFKVIHITNVYFPFIGGISTYIQNLSKGLAKRHVRSMVLSYPRAFWQYELSISDLSARKYVHRCLVLPFILYSMAAVLHEKLNGDVVVHTHSAAFCMFIGVLTRNLLGCRCVHTFHSPIDSCSLVIKYYGHSCDSIVFVSRAAKRLYERVEGTSFPDAKIMPGTVDTELYRPADEDEFEILSRKYEKRFGIASGNRILLFVGRVIMQKGVTPLVLAMKAVNQSVPEACLLIAGPYDTKVEQIREYERALKAIRENEIKNVIFTGSINAKEILELYKLCDIVLCPSKWPELSPMVVVEAMACGKPLVATNVGGLKERVIDGETGFCVNEGRFDLIAEKTILLLSDDCMRIEFGRSGREVAVKEYDISRMLDRYLGLYEERSK